MTNSTRTGTTGRGRPRDPACDRAILAAAREVLAVKGFTGMSMHRVAHTAGVGKDTLYRRVSSKAELVRALLTEIAEHDVPLPADGDDPRGALLAFLKDIVRLNTTTDFGPIVAGLVGAASRDEKLATAFHAFWAERRAVAAELVRRIVGDRTDDEEIERLLDHLVGPVYYRLLLTGAPVDDAFLAELVAAIPGPAAATTSSAKEDVI